MQAMYVLRNIEARSRDYCGTGKEVSITYSGLVSVALVSPAHKAHAPYCTAICGLLTVPYFSTLSHKGDDLKKILNTKCLFWFSLQILLIHLS